MQPPATDCPGAPAMRQPSAPPWDVADLFRLSGETYRRAHAVPPAQQQVMRDLEACRTAPRGGHAEPCPTCGFERDADHACRTRHGPKGQTLTKGQWGEDRTAAWLPVPSCHLVCPVPHDLTPLILAHQRPLLTLLCNAARPTLVPWGPRNLGGQLGCTMVLHPWEQTLGAHVPVHCLMAAGARSANGTRGIDADPRFLLPVRALRPVLRGKCCEALARGGSSAAAPLVEGPPPWALLRTSRRCVRSSTPKQGSSTPRRPWQALHTSWTLSAALPIAAPLPTSGSLTGVTGGAALPPVIVVRAIVSRP